ncbi:hypothetical protein C7212DRAFT_362965 [Tuber magnatum]|uniref:Extracellular membrane protein CFEM domain-containing protein n=1 Tax=Tuber magnatum TaxID=42249 RepID=A0A317SVT8_9PEZI|nr:hypothetical protein C7212DRAFT_362965 [Tuber magnatum]
MPPVKSFLLGASLLLLSGVAQGTPPKPQMTLSPHVLKDCGCDAVVANFLRCQSLAKGGRDCVCENSWYDSSTACRDCLILADDTLGLQPSNDFFGNFEQALTNVFTACTVPEGSISTNGSAVCGRIPSSDACVYLNPKAGEKSWATRQDCTTGEILTGYFELNLGGVPKGNNTKPTASNNATIYPTCIPPPPSTSAHSRYPTSSSPWSATLAPHLSTNGTTPTGYAPGAGNTSTPSHAPSSSSPTGARAGLWASACVLGAVVAVVFV